MGFSLKARGNKVVNVPIPAVRQNIPEVWVAQALSIKKENIDKYEQDRNCNHLAAFKAVPKLLPLS